MNGLLFGCSNQNGLCLGPIQIVRVTVILQCAVKFILQLKNYLKKNNILINLLLLLQLGSQLIQGAIHVALVDGFNEALEGKPTVQVDSSQICNNLKQ